MKNSKTMKKILISALSLSAAVSAVALPMITMTSCKDNGGGGDDTNIDPHMMRWSQARPYFDMSEKFGDLVASVKDATNLLKAAKDGGFHGIAFENVRLGDSLFAAGGSGSSIFGAGGLEEVQLVGTPAYDTDLDPTIGNDCFKGCTNLEIVNLRYFASVWDKLIIGQSAFENCTKLGNRVVHDNQLICYAETTIGSNAFKGCTSLDNAYFPMLHKIGSEAFSGCTHLVDINLGKVIQIDGNAFLGCALVDKISFTYTGGTFSGTPERPTGGTFESSAFPVGSFGTNATHKKIHAYTYHAGSGINAAVVLGWLKAEFSSTFSAWTTTY